MSDKTPNDTGDLAHSTRRMLQALEGYWQHYDGLSAQKRLTVRGRYELEDWWHRFERYRNDVESALTTGNSVASGKVL